MKPQRVLVFVPASNTGAKKDATGAFQPEAVAFKDCLGIAGMSAVVMIDNKKPFPARRKQVLQAIADFGEADAVAFFCHGWLDGIQLGFTRANVKVLAEALVKTGARTFPLYCCSTGEDGEGDPLTAAGTGDDSFSDKLRDTLCTMGVTNCRVLAHTTKGHTTQNPNVLFMDGLGSPVGGAGGIAPVTPPSKLWKTWTKALRTTDLRFRMAFMSIAEIHTELTSGK